MLSEQSLPLHRPVDSRLPVQSYYTSNDGRPDLPAYAGRL